MRKSLIVVVAVCLLTALAEARDLKVTVYNSNIGVVKDVRSTDLEKGINHLSMDEIASRIDPTSVRISIPPRDLASPGSSSPYRRPFSAL